MTLLANLAQQLVLTFPDEPTIVAAAQENTGGHPAGVVRSVQQNGAESQPAPVLGG
ncbi:MAG: hypothetical protein R2932_33845 [Caldilineaceae bacterium]